MKSDHSLKDYHKKRDFKSTPEPRGVQRAGAQKSKLFYCVQKHLASHLHYDFRLEYQGVLLSWAVPKGPSLDPKEKRLAMRVEDHPRDYGEFEGVIPSGYGAGIVMLWDKGLWVPDDPDIEGMLHKGQLKFSLEGIKLKGSWTLIRMHGKDGDRSWFLMKHTDEWSGELDVETFAPNSVTTGGGFDAILSRHSKDIPALQALGRGGEAGKLLNSVIEQTTEPKSKASGKKRAKVSR